MSLPPIAVPKSAAAAGPGPGPGPSPSSQLRATLTSVALPGAPVTPQAPAVPPPQIPRIQPPLEDRLFPTQPGVAAVYSVPRPAGPPYTTHDITKGHPNLAATPPGHGSSPGLSQSPYPSGQNAATQLVYSPPTQPMNAQPQSRPFAAGPRPSHHQFFQRTQMQTVRPSIPSNSPSIRPGSQTPTAAVYPPPNQPIMMTMTPMPFPSPQTAQYYISQYRHTTPQYVGPPQQYSVQPAGPSTFYPSPGPGEFPTPYAGPPYYPGQAVYTPSPPIIVPTPQQPPPTKREKKTIRIRDPNQGGKDITEEIMSGGGSGSRNPTPPVGRPSSTPTPPQQQAGPPTDHGPVAYSVDSAPHLPAAAPHLSAPTGDFKPEEKPKLDPTPPLKPPSPGLQPAAPPAEKSEPTPPEKLPETPFPAAPVPPSAAMTPPAPSVSPGKPMTHPEPPTINGLTDKEASALGREPEAPSPDSVQPTSPPESPPLAPPTGTGTDTEAAEPISKETRVDAAPEAVSAVPPAMPGLSPPSAPLLSAALFPTAAAAAPAAVLAPPPGLTLPPQGVAAVSVVQTRRPSLGTESKDSSSRAAGETEALSDGTSDQQLLSNSRKSPVLVQAASTAPKTWKKPKEATSVGESLVKENQESPTGEESGDKALPRELDNQRTPSPAPEGSQEPPLPEENGEQEAEPLRNGAEHASETESSDSGVTSGDKETPAVAPTYVFQEESADSDGKKQYNRDFLLSFQFMPACVQKPEGLPPIADVVLDKINQNKLPMRSSDSRMISRGPDFTPAFADFGRPSSGGRGAPLLNVGLRRPPPRKIIMNVSVNDEVQLNKAEHAWKPGMKREAGAEDPDSQRTQELFRKVRSILNKLTPQMFNQLMKQVTDLTIDTEERLKGVIDLVFEKAIDEPSFSVAYGNMCRCLATLKVPMADKPNSTVNFRKLLLNRCQKEFEKDKVDDDVFERKQKELESAASASERERLQEELEEAKDKARRRSIGNIKFIGSSLS
ncbi:hypothetical protein GJAV_G00189860 [Gymnothorax javanicus]|nr:hypothetical protein GJAV_G00189860 [Gymnothorax javanicus]